MRPQRNINRNKSNFCLDCNKEIDVRAERCGSCSAKYMHKIGILNNNGKNNGMYGKKLTFTKTHLENMRLNRVYYSGKENGNYIDGRTKATHYCIEINCNNKVSKKGNRCIKCSNKGPNNSRYGKPIKPNWVKYRTHHFRSNWEMWFSQFLTLSGYKWKYESKTFDLGDTTYTPDFYLPEWDLYIEVKGYFSDKAKEKMKKFKELYKNINLEIFGYKELFSLSLVAERSDL